MKNSLLLTCICILSSTILFGQRMGIDSLQLKLRKDITDSARISILDDISYKFSYIDLDSAKFYSEKAMKLAQEYGNENAILFTTSTDIMNGFLRNRAPDSKERYLKLLTLAAKVDSSKQVIIYNMLGQIENDNTNFEEALEYYYQSVEIADRYDDYTNWVIAMVNIANVHYNLQDLQNSKKIYEEILEREDELLPEHHTIILANYINLLEEPEEQKPYVKKAIKIAKEHGIIDTESNGYKMLGDILMNDPDSIDFALENYEKSIELFREMGNQADMIESMGNYGKGLTKIGRYSEAERVLLEAQGLIEELDFVSMEVVVHDALSILYEKTNQHKKGLSSLRQYVALSDSIFKESTSEQLIEANKKYETEKKEAEIIRQELELQKERNSRTRITALAGGGILLLLSGFGFFYLQTRRKKKESELALKLEKQKAKDLENLAKLKTEFFNNINHELRTPLSLIIAPLEDATEKARNVDLRNDIDMALKNSKKLLNLTNEIIDLSKLDDGKLNIEQSEFNLHSFLNRVFFSFESLAESRGISLHFNNEINPSQGVQTDISKLEKILNNLISNAIKYSEQGDEITMNVDSDQLENSQTLHIKIEDSGLGIPEDEIENIFDRYFQSSITPQSAGTGIGLAFVKELVELLDGKIDVESKVGKGSTFSISIPINKLMSIDQASTIEEKESSFLQTPIQIGEGKPKVLIVEDNEEMSDFLFQILSKDYNCQSVQNGREAIEMMEKEKFDLITSDVMMPEMDGFEFRAKVNQNANWKNIPFIMITARSLEEDKLKGFQLGIDDYITKPFSTAELKARAYNLLKNKLSRIESDEEQLSHDQVVVEKASSLVKEHLDNPAYKVQNLANDLNYSTRQLGRNLKKWTGMTPVEFILEHRLLHAYDLLKARKFSTVNEVRYEIGIESHSYFTTKFKERFGISPGKLAE